MANPLPQPHAYPRPQKQQRDLDSDFLQKSWYTFQIPSMLTNSMSSSTTGVISMTEFGKTSAENWQLFPQGGHYFIRNWDYGSQYQLGLTENSKTVPALYQKSGSIAQQWSISKVDGGWELTNVLTGSSSKLSLSLSDKAPVMRSGEGSSTAWNITRNPSAEKDGPKGQDMYALVFGFEVAQSSSSIPSSSSSSTPSTILSSASQQTTASLSSQESSLPPSSSASSSSSSLSGGAIAGIVIGAIAILALVITAAFLFFMRRKRAAQQQYHPHPELYSDSHVQPHSAVHSEKYAHSELAVPPAELAGSTAMRPETSELESYERK